MIASEAELVGLALALGADGVGALVAGERALVHGAKVPDPDRVREARDAIVQGGDPLGHSFSLLRAPGERRPMGATYTPPEIVGAMTEWAAGRQPVRVVDPGAGSGRFVVAAGRAIDGAELVAVEIDPLASLLTRAHLAAAGLADRARVIVADYRTISLPAPQRVGATLFLGNPPYVRHHGIAPRWKRWLSEQAGAFGLSASQLAGLHVHFFLATARLARAGDAGAFVTSAEWLDVNYGSLARGLLFGPLGGESIHVIDPGALPFADAQTTAAVSCFTVGARPASIRFRPVDALASLAPLASGGRFVPRAELERATRWTPFLRAPRARRGGENLVELGELCRVHRGQVTGANAIWIAGPHSRALPRDLLFPAITRARELFAAGDALADLASLARVIDLPADLDVLAPEARHAVDRFLRAARKQGAHAGFVARNRKAWWSVGLRAPAPILATYMARRPPAFVRNVAGARHINIAHGLYPRVPMTDAALDALARYLAGATSLSDGRTYAGGLTKFEPREMERLLVPMPT